LENLVGIMGSKLSGGYLSHPITNDGRHHGWLSHHDEAPPSNHITRAAVCADCM